MAPRSHQITPMSRPGMCRKWHSQRLSRKETVAAFPGGFGSVQASRLGIEPFAELGANSSSLSGSEVDSSCSRRMILGLAPVTVLQSHKLPVSGHIMEQKTGRRTATRPGHPARRGSRSGRIPSGSGLTSRGCATQFACKRGHPRRTTMARPLHRDVLTVRGRGETQRHGLSPTTAGQRAYSSGIVVSVE
jgi:hypothetical protein